ncbi:hypothetical protein [Faecalibacter macacae]|nr:hypothetical protein [Faecalibacter macacae]
MRKRINISLHPVFILISSMYLLIFFTYGIKSLKGLLLTGYHQEDIIGLIISILAVSFFAYLALVRYRRIEIYEDRYVLKSIVASREIYKNEIDSIRKVPLNFFNFDIGSIGVMGVINLSSSGEAYNVSDINNTLRIALKNNEVLHISCDRPEEITHKLI